MARRKSQSNPTPASAKEVREFWQKNPERAAEVAAEAKVSTNSVLGADGDASRIRGRINPVFSAAFTEATGRPYAEKSVAEKPKVTLPVTKKSARGATLKRPVDVTTAEARRLSGQTRGRLSAASLEKAARAYEAERDAS